MPEFCLTMIFVLQITGKSLCQTHSTGTVPRAESRPLCSCFVQSSMPTKTVERKPSMTFSALSISQLPKESKKIREFATE